MVAAYSRLMPYAVDDELAKALYESQEEFRKLMERSKDYRADPDAPLEGQIPLARQFERATKRVADLIRAELREG